MGINNTAGTAAAIRLLVDHGNQGSAPSQVRRVERTKAYRPHHHSLTSRSVLV